MKIGWPLRHARRCFREIPNEPHSELAGYLRAFPQLPWPLPGADVPKEGSERQGLPQLLDFDNDPCINNLIRKLYTRLNQGDHRAQVLIDGYLFLCGLPIATTKRRPMHSRGLVFPDFALVTAESDTIQYRLLPDISEMAVAVLGREKKTDSQLLMLFRQCIPYRKRTKRAQKEMDWSRDEQDALSTCIRILYGLLLGLYPNNAKRTSFRARVAINAMIHALLVAPFDEKAEFFERNRNIFKLALMEHAANTINDFLPAVRKILDGGNQFVQFLMTLSCMCDAFRMELNAEIMKNIREFPQCINDPGFARACAAESLDLLNNLALTTFDRCSRAYRCSAMPTTNVPPSGVVAPLNVSLSNSKARQLQKAAARTPVDPADPAPDAFDPPLMCTETAQGGPALSATTGQRPAGGRRGQRSACSSAMVIALSTASGLVDVANQQWVQAPLTSDQSPFRNIFNMFVCSNRFVFRFINSQIFGVPQTDACWPLIANIQVRELPISIAHQQCDALRRIHGEDLHRYRQAMFMHVCVFCSVKRNFLNAPSTFRIDTVNDQLLCTNCMQPSVLEINTIGRILWIGGRPLYRSLCCGKMCAWTGSGDEWSTQCGPHCELHTVPLFSAAKLAAQIKKAEQQRLNNPPKPGCEICKNKNIAARKHILCMNTRQMRMVFFCGKHAPPLSALNHSFELQDIFEYFRYAQSIGLIGPDGRRVPTRRR